MSDNTQTMVRVTDPIERISHWLLAGSCLFCLFTGLGLMFRSWDFIPALLGGLYALKWMHIFSGVAFAFALISAYLMWKKDCAFEPDDAKWIVQGGGYLWKTDKLPPVQVQCRPEALLLVRSHLRGTHRAHRAGHVEPHGIPGSRGALVLCAPRAERARNRIVLRRAPLPGNDRKPGHLPGHDHGLVHQGMVQNPLPAVA